VFPLANFGVSDGKFLSQKEAENCFNVIGFEEMFMWAAREDFGKCCDDFDEEGAVTEPFIKSEKEKCAEMLKDLSASEVTDW